jgi:hypothetical protein
MFCCGDNAVVVIPVPTPTQLRRNPTVIFTEEREDPVAPPIAEKKEEAKIPEAKETVDVDEYRINEKEDIKDITTVMDPTSVKDIKIRILRMPALPRSPRRLCMRLQKIHSS